MKSKLREWKFCPVCGGQLVERTRFGRERQCCSECSWVRFLDPKVAVAVFIESEQGVLLVQRKNPPFADLWTLPAGFMDSDEEPQKAAERECLEETGLIAEVTGVKDLYFGKDHPGGADIVIFFNARVVGGEQQANDDAKAVGWFGQEELPDLAFRSTKYLLTERGKYYDL